MDQDQERIDRLEAILVAQKAALVERISMTAVPRSRMGLWLSRGLFLGIGLLALANIFFINRLVHEFSVIIGSMNDMYVHFGRVSDRMSHMRDYVVRMEQDIRLMPVIGQQMDEMSANVQAMSQNVTGMGQTIVDMDQKIAALNVNVRDMTARFRNVNASVGNIGWDVNQMSKPIP